MKKYCLNALVTISIYTEVEANSLEEAIEIAEQREIEACNNDIFSDNQIKRVWVADDYDGSPFNICEE